MKRALAFAAFAVVLVAAPRAEAGEKLLGVIVSAAGADTTNISTATPFAVPLSSKITIWCNAAGFVITDTAAAASATTALPVAASTLFPTSTGSTVRSTTAGVTLGKAIVRIFGTGAVTCYVYARSGTE